MSDFEDLERVRGGEAVREALGAATRVADAQALKSMARSPEWYAAENARLERDLGIARRLQSLEPKLEPFQKDLRKYALLVEQAKARIRKNEAEISRLERQGELRKAAREDAKLEREAAGIQSELKKAAALKKSARWGRIAPRARHQVLNAEFDAKRRMAQIEKQLKNRKATRDEATKRRQAMLERGVTFDRMAAG